jgi:quercetin dioxygenase-like cupin family protein
MPLSLRAIAVVSLACVCGMPPARAHDAPGEETVKPVMQQDIAEVPGKHVAMATVSYAPGQAATPHKHPGSLFAYVLEGQVISQLEGEPAKTYGVGDSWYEPPGAHHIVCKNASTTQPAKLLVWAIIGANEPIKQALPASP